MLAHIIAGDVRHSRGQMDLRRFKRDVASNVADWPRLSQGAPAPGTREVQPVEVDNFSVASITDCLRLKECCRLTISQPRKKAIDPFGEIARRQSPPHAFRLHQRR